MLNHTSTILELELASFLQTFDEFGFTEQNSDENMQATSAINDVCKDFETIKENLRLLIAQNQIMIDACSKKSSSFLIYLVMFITLTVNVISLCMLCRSKEKQTKFDKESRILEENVKKLKSKL